MAEANIQEFVLKLHKNYQILREREAKYANAAPLDLLNQIDDYEQAIALAEEAMQARDISPEILEVEFSRFNLALDTVVFIAREEVKRKPFTGQNPYRGLRKFTEDEADFFFGREAAIRQLLDLIDSLVEAETSVDLPDMVAVLGPSGSGKSSLVRAGLIPALHRGELPGSERWPVKVMLPGPHPLNELAALFGDATGRGVSTLRADLNGGEQILHQLMLESLSRAGNGVEQSVSFQSASGQITSNGGPGERTLDRPRANVPGEAVFVLVVDQFEEVFTLCEAEAERRAFLDQLLYVSQTRGNRGFVILTMRADFYGQAADYKRLADIITRNQILVSPMTERELREAILRPAEAVGLELEKELVGYLVRDTAAAPGALPLLQHTLLELFERRDGNLLTLEAYEEIGGVTGSIAHRADAVVDSLPMAQRHIVRRILMRLVQPGEGTSDTRRRAALSEVMPYGAEVDEVEEIVQLLADANLIVTGRSPETDEVILDVSHEALIKEWPRFQSWLDWDRRGLRIRQQLSQAAREWIARARSGDNLYRGARLLEVEEWIADNPGEINPTEAEFIKACQAARIQTRRRTRLIITGLAIGLIMALVGTWLGFRGQQEARKQTEAAQASLLGAQALAEEASQPQRGVLLALESLEVPGADKSAAEEILRQALGLAGGIGLAGDPGLVRALAFTPASAETGNWLAAGGQDSVIRLWNLDQLDAEPLKLEGHTGAVRSLAFSPDGQWLASGSEDATVRLWEMNQPKTEARLLEGHGDWVRALAFSPEGRWLASQSLDGQIRLWDVSQPDPEFLKKLEGHAAFIPGVAFSPDGRWLVSFSDSENVISLWSTADLDSKPLLLEGHTEPVTWIAISPNGRWLASGSEDQTARLWDLNEPETTEPIVLAGHDNRVWSVAFSPDSRWLATGSSDNTARLWDLSNLEQETASPPEARVLRGHQGTIWSVAFSPATAQYPQGRWLATVGGDNTVRLWDLSEPDPEPLVWRGHESTIWETIFSADGRWLVTRSNDRAVSARLWDLSQFESEPVTLREHAGQVNGVAFVAVPGQSEAAQWLASGSSDHAVHLWNLDQPGAKPLELAGHEDNINRIAFSPALFEKEGGPWLATASDDSRVGLWDLGQSPPQPRFLEGHSDEAVSVAFSPDGGRLASGSRDNTVQVWDVNSLKAEPVTLEGHTDTVLDVAFSPVLSKETSSPRLATASDDGRVGLWDLSQSPPQPLFLPGHNDGVLSVAFSPAGRWLASGSRDNTVRVWDIGQPRPALRWLLTDHIASIWAVEFSPDGQWLATGGDDNTARLWNLRRPGKPHIEKTLRGHGGNVWTAAFSPDGYWLATGSEDNTVRLWRIQLDEIIPIACRTAGRNLTAEEWEDFIGDHHPYHLTCPTLPVHPTLFEAARELAKRGQIEEAIGQLNHLLVLDPTLDLDPKAEAEQAFQEAVQTLLDEGKELARAGDVEQATAKFEAARRLDPSLALDPAAEAQRLTQQTVANIVEEGLELADEGALEAGLARFQEAQALNPLEISAEAWHTLCAAGNAHNRPEVVLSACDQAVELAPDNGLFRNSRGLARALTGDVDGAAADFKFFTAWLEENPMNSEQ